MGISLVVRLYSRGFFFFDRVVLGFIRFRVLVLMLSMFFSLFRNIGYICVFGIGLIFNVEFIRRYVS